MLTVRRFKYKGVCQLQDCFAQELSTPIVPLRRLCTRRGGLTGRPNPQGVEFFRVDSEGPAYQTCSLPSNVMGSFGCCEIDVADVSPVLPSSGLPSQAFEYIHYNKGIEGEADYPYRGHVSCCMAGGLCV